jgi:hypothetical protein
MSTKEITLDTDYKSPYPNLVFDGELLWGGDRMRLLRERLAGK